MTVDKIVETIYPATTLSPAPRWVMGVNDLTQRVRAKTYMVDGRIVTLANRKRQVVDTLLRSPVYCATIKLYDRFCGPILHRVLHGTAPKNAKACT